MTPPGPPCPIPAAPPNGPGHLLLLERQLLQAKVPLIQEEVIKAAVEVHGAGGPHSPSGPGPRPAPPGTPAPPPGGWSLRHPRRRRQTHPMPPGQTAFSRDRCWISRRPRLSNTQIWTTTRYSPSPLGAYAPPSGPEGAGSRRTNPPFPLQSASLPPVAALFSTLYLDRPGSPLSRGFFRVSRKMWQIPLYSGWKTRYDGAMTSYSGGCPHGLFH